MEADTGKDHEGFKIPSAIPQDILLIQDLIGPLIPPTQPLTLPAEDPDDSVDSSGESTDSAEEVEANLLLVSAKSRSEDISDSASSSSSSSSSDSESEREEDVSKKPLKPKVLDEEDEDEEEGGAVATTVRTKNELSEPDIMIPRILQVGPDEQLERAGEIMSIVNNVVIIKGGESGTHRASEHALDAETLLVYEDRRVLGYIHETFGPTYQPMYQVKFNSSFPLDVKEARVSRPVFHVPARSKYVFVAELARLRGSDASNVHDEEPAEYELEFSDDETEAAHKARLKERRHASREPSVPASPAHVRDQDVDASYGWNPYAEHGVYDMDLDYGASPSRPKPQPYDDPYSDAYNQPDARSGTATSLPIPPPTRPGRAPAGNPMGQSGYGSDQGRSGQRAHRHHHERGRGRGHGRGRGRGRGRGGARGQDGHLPPHRTEDHGATQGPAGPLSPTSTMMAPATGQYYGASEYTPFPPQLPSQFGFAQPYTPMQQQQQQQFMSPQQHTVPPHINPRFAAQFGLNMEMMQHQPGQQYPAYGRYETPTTPAYEGGWEGQWSQGYSSSSGGDHPHVEQEHDPGT